MIDKGLLDLLVCPENHTPLHLADDALVQRLNEAIAAGRLRNRGGQTVTNPIEGGLIREDGMLLYTIVEQIPVMLIDEAIPLEQLKDT
jgi:uncharacterized protein YbaR (Trm112 family)